MGSIYEQISFSPFSTIIARWNKDKYYSTPLHYHDEYEIIYNLNSSGKRYVGDSVEPFEPCDLVLLGSKLPHTWQNDTIFSEKNSENVKAVVIQFGTDFLRLIEHYPEFASIKNMLYESQRGLSFSTEIIEKNHSLLLSLPLIDDGFERIISILKLLHHMAQPDSYRHLASPAYLSHDDESNFNRITETLNYIAENYHDKLTLDEIAERYHMSTTAFCNYFKRKTGKTLINYINEIRVSQACKLLSDTDKQVAEIAYECGFNNISNFNRIFKRLTNKTPKTYKQLWRKV
ncbi:AraC family transcriptional regulator [Puteibacter caeruleilacunae]|nr:AraC family transcriptional regulator [Puteibacter caeruleilacunae]